jgi:hypothetical protein
MIVIDKEYRGMVQWFFKPMTFQNRNRFGQGDRLRGSESLTPLCHRSLVELQCSSHCHLWL